MQKDNNYLERNKEQTQSDYDAMLLVQHLLMNSKREENKEWSLTFNVKDRGHNFNLQSYSLLTKQE